MHIVFVIDSDAFGGAEVYTRILLRRLPATFRRTLVVSEPVARHFADGHPAGPVVTGPCHRHRDRAPELQGLLRSLRADAIQVNLVDPESNRAALAAATATAPTVATLHLEGGVSQANRQRLRDLFGRVNRAVAVSSRVHTQLRGMGVPAHRVLTVRNGIDLPADPGRPPRRTRPRIVAVGRLTEQKGFDLLIAAAARLRQRGRRFEVAIAGEGRERARLERQAADLPVRLLGHRPSVGPVLRWADVFCLPSRRDALPFALMEAMAHGLPCVATGVSDVRAGVGADARVVEVDDLDGLTDALDRLIADASLRRDLGTRARRRAVEHFDAAPMVERTAAILCAAGDPGVAAPPCRSE